MPPALKSRRQTGHKVQGFEAFLSTKDAARKRLQAYKTEDRLFSLSSTTSHAVRLSRLLAVIA